MNIMHPVLALDESRCRNNIGFMAKKASENGCVLRPHFKTHQSKEVGRWYYQAGVRNITVSSIAMARYFAGHWEDITLAVPFNIRAIDELNELLQKQKMVLMVDSISTSEFLSDNLRQPVELWIEIDSGDHRTGINPDNKSVIDGILETIAASPNLKLKGFYSHAGHSYKDRGKEEVLNTLESMKKDMLNIKERYHDNYGPFEINIGDTPCCVLGEDLSWADSISAGNFVFFDVMQSVIGSCTTDQLGVAMVCPVISKNEERREIAIHGGVVHFGKDVLTTDAGPQYGLVATWEGDRWGSILNNCRLKYISQEHGIIHADEDTFSKINIGDLLAVLPVHSCISADSMRGYVTLDGKKADHMKGMGI